MPIASTGPVTFSDLRTEFIGGNAAINFSDLYRGGGNSYIRAKAGNNTAVNLAPNVPTSGAISVGDFRGAARGFKFTFTSGATNQDASTIFGDDYAVNYPKEIVINSGVEIGATSASNEALEINSGGAGTITITNNGTLTGAGGAAGGDGGDAFEANSTCIFINNGLIRSGGGGGGAGGAGGTGGGGQTTSTASNASLYVTASGGSGSYTCPNPYGGYSYTGVYVVTSLMMDSYTYKCYGRRITVSNTSGGAGGAGGAGTAGQGYNQSAGSSNSGSSGANGGTNAGSGGSGGSSGSGGAFGVAGTNGSSGTSGTNGNRTNGASGGSGSNGGAAGAAIRGISSVTLTNNGTITGGQV